MSRDSSVALVEDDSEIKPLRGHLSTERHLIVAANPFEANTPNNLSIIKTGHLAGVGEWKLSLQSDEVSLVCFHRVSKLIASLYSSPLEVG